jgi:CSLREA domain-containing protein
MRHRAAWIAGAVSAALLTGATPVRAATFDVTKSGDGADGACTADCSLREAVIAANDIPGHDTITLHAQTYTLSLAASASDDPGVGDLDVTDDVRIEGAGADQSVVDGGAIDRVFDVASGASADLTGLAVRNGRTTGSGAGILNAGTLTLTDAAVVDNRATGGGGIHNFGVATITRVTLSGNAGAEAASGLSNYGTMSVTNSTVSGSVTTSAGTGVASSAGRLTLRNVTLGANAGGTGMVLAAYFDGEVTVVNTIVDGPCEGAVAALGHNFERGHTCGLERFDTDPMLEPLAANGGPTQTRALAPGSPAIDAGDDAVCPATDQRGVTRPQGPRCDAGAFERAGAPPPAGNTPTGANVPVALGTVTITFAHVTVAGDTTVTRSGSGPPPPAGFAIDGGYYELATTAQYDSAEVCFAYAAPPAPSVAHFEGGAWRILPTTRETGSVVCARVTSFSPFALVRPKGAREQLAELIEQVVAASRLSPAAKALLLDRLRSALAAFDPGNPAQRRAACLALAGFTVLVRAQGGHADWIAAAGRISVLLGCPR